MLLAEDGVVVITDINTDINTHYSHLTRLYHQYPQYREYNIMAACITRYNIVMSYCHYVISSPFPSLPIPDDIVQSCAS